MRPCLQHFIITCTFLICFSFAEAVIKAQKGESGIVEPTFVYLPGVAGGDAIAKETGVDYFSVPVELGVGCSPSLYDITLTMSLA